MITTRVIASIDELDEIATAWHQLAEKSALTPFQTFPWIKSWWSLVGEHDSSLALHILVLSDARGICAIAPFMIREESHGPVLRFATDPWADYQDILLEAANPDSDSIFAAISEHVRAGLGNTWAAVVLDEIPSWSGFMLSDGIASCAEQSSISYRLLLHDVVAVEKMMKGRHEHVLKRRRLARLGRLGFTIHAEPDPISSRMPLFMTMHLRQWISRPDRITFDDPSIVRYYFGMVERMGHAGLLALAELTLDDQPIAFHLGFNHRGTFWAYRAAFETDARRYSPGHLLNQSLIEALTTSGFHTLDFMRGDHSYKREYANRCMVNRRILNAEGNAEPASC